MSRGFAVVDDPGEISRMIMERTEFLPRNVNGPGISENFEICLQVVCFAFCSTFLQFIIPVAC